MVTIIKTEFMKLKRYFIVWIGVSLMLLTVLLGEAWEWQSSRIASRISFTVHISILSFRSNDLFMSGGGVFPV